MTGRCKFTGCPSHSTCYKQTGRAPYFYINYGNYYAIIHWDCQHNTMNSQIAEILSNGGRLSYTWQGWSLPFSLLYKEAKKETDEVALATIKQSHEKHGGDHASKEVKNSPNPVNDGKQIRKRGKRGGASKAAKRTQANRDAMIASIGNGNSYAPPSRLIDNPGIRHYAKKIASVLSTWAGTNTQEASEEERFDVLGFIKATETGEDLRPYIEAEFEEDSVKVLVTPDFSGSCSWCSKITGAFARELSKTTGIDVTYVENCNGYPFSKDGWELDWRDIPASFDCVIYVGDYDAIDQMEYLYSSGKAKKIIALSNYGCNHNTPQVDREFSHHNVIWVTHVNGNDPEDIYRGFQVAACQ